MRLASIIPGVRQGHGGEVMSSSSSVQPIEIARRPPPTREERFLDGGWYFVVIIGSAGILSPVPVWHAWSRLRRRSLLALAGAYTAGSGLLLAGLSDAGHVGDTAPATTNHSGILALGLMVSASLVLQRPRREVFGLDGPRPLSDDPAVARALDNRARRDRARTLAAADPGSPVRCASAAPTCPATTTTAGWWM